MPSAERLVELAPLAQLYHENSKLHPATAAALAERVAEFTTDSDELRRAATGFKTYATDERIDLRALATTVPREPLSDVLARRRSTRVFRDEPLPLPLLAALLERACGVTGELTHADHPDLVQPVRACPSGGALYPIEIYVAAFDVAGLSPGLYHHNAPQRSLELLRHGAFRATFAEQLWLAGSELTAPAVIVLTGRWERTLRKYSERGYRMLLLDAGHVSAHLLLTATGLGLGGCPIGGFFDDRLAETLAIDPREEPVLLCLMVGRGT